MPVPVATRARTYLADSSHYLELSASDTIWSACISLSDDESLIGVYRNFPEDLEQSIVITSIGLHYICDSTSKFVDYENLLEASPISHDKNFMLNNPEARKLLLKLKSGEELEIPVIGLRGGGAADIASFQSFLRGAIQTKRIEREKAANKNLPE